MAGPSAISNSPGGHRRYLDATLLRDGKPVPVRNFSQYCFRSEPVHGDHHSDYAYYRHIQSVVRDTPMRNEYYTSQDHLRVDTDFISGFYPLPYWSPPQRYDEEVSNARSRAITEALNKLRANKVQNGADLGEARKTANMIASLSVDILSAANAARLGNWAFVAKKLGWGSKGIANRWLEYIYGWKPLMSSIHGNMKLLCDLVDQGQAMDIRAVRTVTQDFPEIVYGRSQRESFIQTWTGNVVAQVGLKARVTCPTLAGADMFGLLNPLEIAWELTPFSFVFDWFIPVGNCLQALSATAGLDFASGWVSIHSTSNLSTHWNMEIPTTMVHPGDFQWVDYSFNRVPLTSFPLPELYGKTNPFSTSHILSAIALIRQSI